MTTLAACAARDELLVKSAVVPVAVDLSGRWQLQVHDRETIQRIDDAGMAAAGGLEKVVPVRQPKSGERPSSSKSGSLVYVFLETGQRLKVTQTDDGLFVSFDRSIVEEYRFGEKRVVAVGPVEADRVSGWEGESYVIETLDQDNNKMSESYHLSSDGNELIRSIRIAKNGDVQLDLQQIFDLL